MQKSMLANSCMIALFLIALVFASPGKARAESMSDFNDDPSGAIAADLLVVRPVSLLATACGELIFLGTLPFTVWGGKDQVKKVGDFLVLKPAAYSLDRPVGQFDWEPDTER